jgi:predicted peptidase
MVTTMRILIIVLLLVSWQFALETTLPADDLSQVYIAKIFKDADGQALPYRLLSPEKIEPGKSYPLVLFLHGAGERGNDNAAHLAHCASEFSKAENLKKHPCFVVAPQCPKKRRWVEVDWGAKSHTMPKEPSVPMGLTLKLVERLAADLPVDKARIYVTGISMGGYGAWDAIQRRPELFAAAMPVCGGGDEAEAPKLKNVPIWAFHGDQDMAVPTLRTLHMIEAITKAGGKPKMTIYPGVGHDSWTATFSNPEVLDWLFAQVKPLRAPSTSTPQLERRSAP